MERAARGLLRLKVRPAILLTSPLPRALQTAEIIQASADGRPPLKILDALSPGGKRSGVYRAIHEHRDLESAMLVGHQPSLGEIAGDIAWGSPECYVEFKKGGACAIELEQTSPVPRGSMLWLLTPATLRKLA